jgi:hypothetical protein
LNCPRTDSRWVKSRLCGAPRAKAAALGNSTRVR